MGASALVLASAAGPALAAPPAADAPSGGRVARAVAAAGGRAEVLLESVRPVVPVKNGSVVLSGTVRNTGGRFPAGSVVGIRTASSALSSRSEISDVLARKGATAADGTPVPGVGQSVAGTPGGGSAVFTLKVPVAKLRLQGDGVYELSVEVRAKDGASLGITRTVLPWFPEPSTVKKTRTATLWPVVDQPRISARTMPDQQQTPVFLNDGLTAELKDSGRLGTIVRLGDSLPVTWVVDPDLTHSADVMTRGYRVAGKGGTTRAGHGAQAAGNWLENLRWSMVTAKQAAAARKQIAEAGGGSSANPSQNPSGSASPDGTPGPTGSPDKDSASPSASSSADPSGTSSTGGTALPNPSNYPHDDIVALPSGDPDLASIAHRGGSVKELPALLSGAQELSDSPATSLVLGAQPRTDVAWPIAGALDTAVLKAGRQAHATSFITSSGSLRQHDLSYTPAAARALGGGTSAVVADDGIASILAGDLSTANKRTLAVQEFLAQTLLMTMEAPSKQRTLLVTPPRRMSANTATTLSTALLAAAKGGWIDPVSLKQVQQTKPDAAANAHVPSPSSYPRSLAAGELSTASLSLVGTVHDRLQQMVPILTAPQRVTGPFNGAMMRTVATAWRDDQEGENRYETSTSAYLDSLMGAVKIAPKTSTVTLSGQSATIPITVYNNLEQTVQVRLQLVSEQPTRVTVGKPHTLVIHARTYTQAEFPTTATTNGRALITAQLMDAQGRAYGDPQNFYINVTSVGDNVLIIVGIGLLVVVVAIIRMYRKRAKRLGVEDDPDAPPAPEGGSGAAGSGDGGSGGADGPEPPEGVAPDGAGQEPKDTGSDGVGQTRPDEKVDG